MSNVQDAAGYSLCPRCQQRLLGHQPQLGSLFTPEAQSIHRACAEPTEVRFYDADEQRRRGSQADQGAWVRDARP